MGGVVYDKVRKNISFCGFPYNLVCDSFDVFYHTFSFIDYPHINRGGPAKNSDLIGHLKKERIYFEKCENGPQMHVT